MNNEKNLPWIEPPVKPFQHRRVLTLVPHVPPHWRVSGLLSRCAIVQSIWPQFLECSPSGRCCSKKKRNRLTNAASCVSCDPLPYRDRLNSIKLCVRAGRLTVKLRTYFKSNKGFSTTPVFSLKKKDLLETEMQMTKTKPVVKFLTV